MERRQSSDSEEGEVAEERVSEVRLFGEEVSEKEISEEEKVLKSLRRKNIEYKKVENNLEEKITNTKSVFNSLSVAKELSPKKEEMNQLKKELIYNSLMEILSENQYKFTPERLIDIKKMVREIDGWFKNLSCNYKGCKNQAINELLY